MQPSNAYFVPRRRVAIEQELTPRTPAGRIVRLFGGVEATASAAGVSIKSVYRWLQARDAGGTGGRVPHAAREPLIAAAGAKGHALALADFEPKTGEAYQ